MRRRNGRRALAPFLLALLPMAVPLWAGAQEGVPVIEVTLVVSDDLPRFHDTLLDEPPAQVLDGTLWLGPAAAQALRWSQSAPGITLGGGVDGLSSLGGIVVLHEGHSGSSGSHWQSHVLLGRDLPAAPATRPPTRVLIDLTLGGPGPPLAPLWPAGLTWRVQDEDLVVAYDEESADLMPGEKLELSVGPLTIPLSYRFYESASKDADPSSSFPQAIERDGGSITVSTTLAIQWHGPLPVEVIE